MHYLPSEHRRFLEGWSWSDNTDRFLFSINTLLLGVGIDVWTKESKLSLGICPLLGVGLSNVEYKVLSNCRISVVGVDSWPCSFLNSVSLLS